MSRRVELFSAVAVAGALLACSSGGGGTSDGGSGSGSGGTSSGSGSGASGSGSGGGSGSSSGGTGTSGVSLSVASASSPATVGGLASPSGSFFFVVDLTLKNAGASTPLSTSPVLFSLQTSQALVISAAPAQASGECSATLSVASGGQDACGVAFEVPTGQTPTTLVYDDQRGDKATAPVPTVVMASGACQTYAGWFKGASQACIMCLGGAVGVFDAGSAPCQPAADTYRGTCQKCASMCDPLLGGGGGSVSPCACELGCDTAQCQTIFQTYVSCMTSTCGGSCP